MTTSFYNRRQWLQAGAALASAGALGGLHAQTPASPKDTSRLILLGTAGGPTPKPNRVGPSNAIVVNGATYVVDAGNGVARQLVLAKLRPSSIRKVFITHHHSDHNADLGNLLLLSWAADLTRQVDVYGPPPLQRMNELFLEMNRYDIDTRIADEGRPPLKDLIRSHELTQGGVVMKDENVTVTAALVNHPPVVPSFAYRFDCPDRSIVFSGDTAPSDNLIRLAQGADVLVHEVMHMPSLDQLIATEPNAKTLREHLIASHTTTEQVGRIAAEAGVKTLVLSHFVPGGYPFLKDEVWFDAVRPHFSGRLVVGRDLLEL